jgi:hypothetical protein
MPGNISREDLIWIEDAVRAYDRSRRWLQDQVTAGRLTGYSIEGDKKMYLSRSELEALLAPRPIERKDDGRAG